MYEVSSILLFNTSLSIFTVKSQQTGTCFCVFCAVTLLTLYDKQCVVSWEYKGKRYVPYPQALKSLLEGEVECTVT